MMRDEGLIRIGELSRRSGVTAELLRAWERRYGLLRPARSAGGLRLYSAADLERVRLMREHLDSGLAAAEAAALTLGDQVLPGSPGNSGAGLPEQLVDALNRFDEPRAQTVIDQLLAAMTLESVLGEVFLPYLRELGERWQRGEASIAQEHFASGVLRGRLLGLARGWGLGVGPQAVLACLPGEQHDLGLIGFGLALRSRGWRIVFLGCDTPIETAREAARAVDPNAVVLSATAEERISPVLDGLRSLLHHYRIGVGGAAATSPIVDSIGLLALTGDPVSEARRVSAESLKRP